MTKGNAATMAEPVHDPVSADLAGRTLVLTLKTPGKPNVPGVPMYRRLTALLGDARSDPDIANVILQGAEGSFCAVDDLRILSEGGPLSVSQRGEGIEELHRLVRLLRAFPKPVIAAIEGGAVGAGASLAFAADMIVAAENSYFALSNAKAGQVPDGGVTGFLDPALPPQSAAEMALLGERVPAARLAAMGVVNRLAPAGRALDTALDLAAETARGAREAQSGMLALLDAAGRGDLEAQLDREKRAITRALGFVEAAAGIAASKEKCVPTFPTPAASEPPSRAAVETDVTRLFGTRLPIVAGGLMWLADAGYVAAAAKAGITGFITAASFADPGALRAEIRRCRDMADGLPFGVNISMLPKLVEGERTRQIFELVAEEGVAFIETSGRSPETYLPIARAAGIKVLHKVSSLRHAVKAQSIGVDAVSIVGAECGGHPGVEMIGSMVNAGLAASRLTIPWLIGGGIGTGAQVAAVLAMGGAGVVIGTRFLVADEVRAHPDYKQALIDATERDTELGMHTVRNTVRALANDTMRELRQIETERPDVTIQDLLPLVSGKIARQAYETGDITRGVLSAGQSLGAITGTAPLSGIVGELEEDMVAALRRAGGLLSASTS
ncbi:enoyl-CoA hydratase-related protein [Microvirga sp. M2]|uniref:enoyl-CoA hydratase-related protein n=1 Tax=Microvirga sp. M2 TaxID=3073270 RepID=UPI0039C33302